MSITSCPRCSGQVTLPVGASNRAQVRCPLCHAHYSLADALVNMPPLLEVVDDTSDHLPADSLEGPDDDDAVFDASETSTVAESEFQRLSLAGQPDDDAPLAMTPDDDALTFEADEADDALDGEGHDTEVEELSFSTFDSVPALPPEVKPAKLTADDDDGVLDFGEPLARSSAASDVQSADVHHDHEVADDEATIDFGGEELSEKIAPGETLEFGAPLPPDAELDDEIKFDLEQPETLADTDATIEFSNAPSIRSDEDDVVFDLDATDAVSPAADGGLRPFGDLKIDAPDDAEEISADVPRDPAPRAVPVEETSGKKGKKKKEKAAGGKPKRSLVGMAMPSLIALPLVAIGLYGALWAGFDPVGLANYLPGFLVPSGMTKKVARYTPPQSGSPAPSVPADSDAGVPQPEEPAAPSGEHTAARPTDPGTDPDAEAPADEKPALEPGQPNLSAEPAPAEQPGAAPAEAPAEMPAEGATPAADDPFKKPAAPAEGAPDFPAEPENKPADADPFDKPQVEAMPEKEDPLAPAPAADDPFGPSKDETPSEPSSPAEKPAADDPFGSAEPLPAPAEPAKPLEQLGPRNAPQVTMVDLQKSQQAMMAAGQQMMAAQATKDEAQLRKARANFYVSLFDMANALTLSRLGPDGPQLEPQLRAMEPAMRAQLSADPKQLELLKVFGARWFAFPKRTNNGVVLAGTVASVDQVGKLFHTKVRQSAAADAPLVTIVSAADPQVALDDEVVTLGSIVEQPEQQLAGYEGSEPSVVWSGMTLKMPAAAK